MKIGRYRTIPIGTFSIAFECKDCGGLFWRSGIEIHDKFHDALASAGIIL